MLLVTRWSILKASRFDQIIALLAQPHPLIWTATNYYERVVALEKALAEAMKEAERVDEEIRGEVFESENEALPHD